VKQKIDFEYNFQINKAAVSTTNSKDKTVHKIKNLRSKQRSPSKVQLFTKHIFLIEFSLHQIN